MEYIERPKEVIRAEASVQSDEFIQKNSQEQLNRIYDYLDELIGSTLYEDEGLTNNYNSSSFTATFKENIDNYERLKVYANINGYNAQIEVYTAHKNASGHIVCSLAGGSATSTNYLYLPCARLTLNSTGFTIDRKYQVEISALDNTSSITACSAKVLKIVGFK